MSAEYYRQRLIDLLPRLIKRGNGLDRCSICHTYTDMGYELMHQEGCPASEIVKITSDPYQRILKAEVKLMTEQEYFLHKMKEGAW